MSHGDAPWAAMADDVVDRLRNELTPKHVRIIDEFTETRRELAEARRDLADVRQELARAHQERYDLRKRLDEAVRRLEEIEERNSFVEALAQYFGREAENGRLPQWLTTAITTQTPRPPSIDRACAGDPNEPAECVDLPQYGKTVYVKRGSDPDVTWSDIAGLGEGTDDEVEE